MKLTRTMVVALFLTCPGITWERKVIREISQQNSIYLAILTNAIPAPMQNNEGSQCNSMVCEKNVKRIEYLLDNSVDPCEDFFQYACSSKHRGKEFPYARKEVIQNLTKLIVEATGEYSFLKDFYDSCVSIPSRFSKEKVAKYCLEDNKCSKKELESYNIV